MSSSPVWAFLIVFALCSVVIFSAPAYSASFVLGKQYLLKQKKQNSSLVWYAVTFERSIVGGLKLTLKVYSEKGQSLEFLDDYRDFVADDIAERCISKFAMTNYNMDFDDTRKGALTFQVKSVSDVIYVPLKVKYVDGFEDYLVRIRILNGKFAISTRPLQQGMLITPDENAVENYRADQLKIKQDLDKKAEAKKVAEDEVKKKAEAKMKAQVEEAKKEAPKVFVNEELFDPANANMDELLKESESEFKDKEDKARGMILPTDVQAPLETEQPIDGPANDPTDESASGTGSADGVPPNLDSLDSILNEIPAPKNSVIAPVDQNTKAPVFEKLEDFDQPITPLLKDDKTKPPSTKFEDNELEIDGFEDALKEIERLEQLEKNK